ncbi:hypothetical protein ACI6Q5_05525 [Xanthomonas codiaei]|uniref:Uncharacterized protein n=1 Tax=Xanthomonas codiaei TaxID=56463 RepID=A0A2S7CGS4_9XANT|nr:hypothetical protein [Xanthomonas codiaei]PPU60773.1 hypothetical protein XcodCFBP4690_16975 [Xanthomonas codiaei]
MREQLIADTAVAAMGFAWLPYGLIRERLRHGELVEAWGTRPTATMDCYAVWPGCPHLPLCSRLAIDALVDELPKYLNT